MSLQTNPTLTAIMNVHSTVSMKKGSMRLNMQVSIFLFFPPLEGWVPQQQLYISIGIPSVSQMEDPLQQSDELVMLPSWLLPSVLHYHVHQGLSFLLQLKCCIKQCLPKPKTTVPTNKTYRTKNREKRERWGFSSPKASLLQCQVNGG